MQRLAIDGGRPVRTRPLPTVLEPAGRTFGEAERAAVLEVLDGAVLNSTCGGPWVADLEDVIATMHGANLGVACSSGTAALHLAVAAVDPEPGDEIITTPLTDFGTIIPILAQNAVPVFADVDPLTGNLDPGAVEALISDRTRAIIVVHLFGQPATVAELVRLADRHGVTLIEDCAQAYLARPDDDGPPVGSYGAVGCFSLQQYKHVTAGDGGVSITNDGAIAERMRLFADKGWPRSEGRRHEFLGVNYRMNNLTAAVAAVQARRLPDVVGRRRQLARRLFDQLGELDGVCLPSHPDRHSFWVLPLILEAASPGANHAWAEALADEGVPAHAGWLPVPVYAHPVLRERRTYGRSAFPLVSPPARRDWTYPDGLCPEAERLISHSLIVLPWNEGYTDDDVDDIAAALMKVHTQLNPGRR